MKVEELFKKHQEIKLPDFPENDLLAEWVENLIELDMYYAGLVSSQGGNRSSKIDSKELNELRQRLTQFKHIKRDAEILVQCEEYLKSLEHLISCYTEKT